LCRRADNIRIPAIPGYSGPGVLYYKGNHATANAFGTFKQEDELTAMMPPRGDEHEDDDATIAVRRRRRCNCQLS